MPGRLIDVNGESIHVVVEGTGPLVMFDSGLGGSTLEWGAVAADLVGDFTVVRYDRPGFGWSPASAREPSLTNAAARIRGILTTLDLDGPAILVGHSLGGLHVRAVAALFPDLVSGLVLVDPSHENMLDAADTARNAARMTKVMAAIATTAPLGTPRVVGRLYSRMLAGQVRGSVDAAERESLICSTLLNACSVAGMRTSVREMTALPQTLQQVKELATSHPLPAIPVTVISADAEPRTATERTGRETIRALHEAQVQGTPHGRLVLAANSGHLVPLDEPRLIAASVREVAAATSESLRSAP